MVIGTSNPPHWSSVVLAQIEPDQSGAVFFLLSDGLVQPPARAIAMTAHSELSAPGFVVIVLDDDLAVRNSLKFSLELEGFTVRSYATGAELLGTGDPPPCGCLVVDQHMPGMSGLDLIDMLRSRHFSAPAILITGDPSPSVRDRARKAAVPIVEKPLLGNALLRQIRDAAGEGRG
jgi:CheY-like chemotaxis protein